MKTQVKYSSFQTNIALDLVFLVYMPIFLKLAVTGKRSVKNTIWKSFAKVEGKHLWRILFLVKQGFHHRFFSWNLRNFSEKLFCRNFVNGCLYHHHHHHHHHHHSHILSFLTRKFLAIATSLLYLLLMVRLYDVAISLCFSFIIIIKSSNFYFQFVKILWWKHPLPSKKFIGNKKGNIYEDERDEEEQTEKYQCQYRSFVWDSALREGLRFRFSGVFC